ncbi:MAG TPA: M15 family metallopeptidase [Burkholderiaceae bacterium]
MNGLPIEQLPGHADFRRLDSIADIGVELRYATPDNFVGRDLYSPNDCAWLHRDAAAGLERAVAWLAERRPDVKVLVLDALRPQRVQEQLWAALQGTDLLMYLAPPERGSIHSFGMALDLTLTVDDVELDMGTPFDDLTELAHPKLEQQFLEQGALTPAQLANRELLRGAMQAGGFVGISTEWWHFDCGDRNLVRDTYTRIL